MKRIFLCLIAMMMLASVASAVEIKLDDTVILTMSEEGAQEIINVWSRLPATHSVTVPNEDGTTTTSEIAYTQEERTSSAINNIMTTLNLAVIERRQHDAVESARNSVDRTGVIYQAGGE